jgi:hypothetical protein
MGLGGRSQYQQGCGQKSFVTHDEFLPTIAVIQPAKHFPYPKAFLYGLRAWANANFL